MRLERGTRELGIFVLILILVLLGLSSIAQVDTIRTDTIYAYHTQRTITEERNYATPEDYGANRFDMQPDDRAIQRAINSGLQVRMLQGGKYIIINTIEVQKEHDLIVDAEGATFQNYTAPVMFEIRGNIENSVTWRGGNYIGVNRGNVFDVNACYNCQFTGMEVSELDTFFIGRWVMNSLFEFNHLTNVKQGFYFSPIYGASTASTSTTLRNNRMWSQDASGFLTVDRGNTFRVQENVIEGWAVENPISFDFRGSGVAKVISIRNNHIECESLQGILLRNSNGTTINVDGNYFASRIPVAVRASGELPIVINYHGNFAANTVFEGQKEQYWNFSGYSKEYFNPVWLGVTPYYWRGEGGKRHRL